MDTKPNKNSEQTDMAANKTTEKKEGKHKLDTKEKYAKKERKNKK